jgi:hypothetical protein
MTQARCKIAGWATHQQKRKKWAQKEKDVDHGRPRKNEGRNHAEPQQAFDGPVCKRPSPGPQRVWAPQWFFFFFSYPLFVSKTSGWLFTLAAWCLLPSLVRGLDTKTHAWKLSEKFMFFA